MPFRQWHHHKPIIFRIGQAFTSDIFVTELAVGGQIGKKAFAQGIIKADKPVGNIRLRCDNQDMLF